VLIATAAGPDISAVRPALEEPAFNECVQELTARRVVKTPQAPRLIATKGESRHFPVLGTDSNQDVLPQHILYAGLHSSSGVKVLCTYFVIRETASQQIDAQVTPEEEIFFKAEN